MLYLCAVGDTMKIMVKTVLNNLTLKEAILDLGYLTSEEFDLYVQPEKMIHK